MNRHNLIRSSIIPAVISSCIGLSTISMQVRGDEYASGLLAYENGDYRKAFELFKVSAESGTAKSQLLLSTMYRRGIGVKQNEYESFY